MNDMALNGSFTVFHTAVRLLGGDGSSPEGPFRLGQDEGRFLPVQGNDHRVPVLNRVGRFRLKGAALEKVKPGLRRLLRKPSGQQPAEHRRRQKVSVGAGMFTVLIIQPGATPGFG